jgi:type II secretory pathway pseudopilin PulG
MLRSRDANYRVYKDLKRVAFTLIELLVVIAIIVHSCGHVAAGARKSEGARTPCEL